MDCFWNQFFTSGSGQTENTQIRSCAYFLFDHFLMSKIDFESSFEMRRSIFLIYKKKKKKKKEEEKKNCSVLTKTKKVEHWIFHCIFKSCAEGLGVLFMLERYFFHQTPCIYLLFIRGGRQTSAFDSLIKIG